MYNDTFENCENLESVKLPPNLVNINPFVFYNCKKLKLGKIPNSVTYIGTVAFSGCSSLEKIKMPNTPPRLDNNYSFPGQVIFVCSNEFVKEEYLTASIWNTLPSSRFIVE